MKSVYGFVIEPAGQRYNNSKELDGKKLITNTEIFNHQFVNKLATVILCMTDNYIIKVLIVNNKLNAVSFLKKAVLP